MPKKRKNYEKISRMEKFNPRSQTLLAVRPNRHKKIPKAEFLLKIRLSKFKRPSPNHFPGIKTEMF